MPRRSKRTTSTATASSTATSSPPCSPRGTPRALTARWSWCRSYSTTWTSIRTAACASPNTRLLQKGAADASKADDVVGARAHHRRARPGCVRHGRAAGGDVRGVLRRGSREDAGEGTNERRFRSREPKLRKNQTDHRRAKVPPRAQGRQTHRPGLLAAAGTAVLPLAVRQERAQAGPRGFPEGPRRRRLALRRRRGVQLGRRRRQVATHPG